MNFFIRFLLANLLLKVSEQSHIINNFDIRKYHDVYSTQSPITYIHQLKSFENNFEKNVFKQQKLSKSSRENFKAASNQELLNVLGFHQSKMSLNQKRKSYLLSKNQYQPDNSKIFIIKLPPNQNYYAANNVKYSKDKLRNELIPLGFTLNGKPGALYHWNLPIIENLLQLSVGRNNKVAQSKEALYDPINSMLEARENFNDYTNDGNEQKNLRKKSVQVYYAPSNGNHFSTKPIYTNGKPKSFYILKKDSEEAQHKELIKLT
ncbi:unnamed protein product [Chironomus riparius]|uniref:Uncharacterized protein n=1 Tax=Chironomus riparius TaxID=315576 RepID=A0A9N9WXS3_9DIPT|nr:unnamed protein product [Chironomus riparius]